MNSSGPAFVIGAWIGLLVGILVVSQVATPDWRWQAEAVKHNAAQYNATTGKFEWKDGEK